MIGALVGDVVGSRFEFDNHRSKDFELFDPTCIPTDDSIMTLAVAKSLMETLGESPVGEASEEFAQRLSDATVHNMRAIGQRYPRCGYGGRFLHWMFDTDPQPYNSFGNGAAMRISPVGFLAEDLATAIQWSTAVTRVTHNHPEGLKGAEATTAVILLARQGSTKDEIREFIQQNYYPLDFTIDQIRPTYRFDETCQRTVPQSIQCFLESESFEDAIRTAISLGGDSDTIAAIVGSMAEAFYGGVPDAIEDETLEFFDDDLLAIVEQWNEFVNFRVRIDSE